MKSLAGQGLLARHGRSYELEAIEPLLDAFLRDYRGPAGAERAAYSLEPPNELAARVAAKLGRCLGKHRFGVSADVGPDLLKSWRKPTHAILYLRETVPLDELGLVDARGHDDANVFLRLPADLSLFANLIHATSGSTPIPLEDQPQMMWDLLRFGGDDREEAAGRLREWFVHR